MPEREPTPEDRKDIDATALTLRLSDLCRGRHTGPLPAAILARPIVRIAELLYPLWQNDARFEAEWRKALHGLYADAARTPMAWRFMEDADNLAALEALYNLLARQASASGASDGGDVHG